VSYQQHRHSKKKKTKQRAKEGKQVEERKKNCRPARISSPGRRHQHLHEAVAERQEHYLYGRTKKQGKKIAHRSRGKKKEDQRLPPQPVAVTPTPP